MRSRWAAIGAAVAVALCGGGVGWMAHADDPGAVAPAASFVTITPCRLFDTRAATQVGDRGTPLVAGETLDRQVWNKNGNCTIPTAATAITYNVTVPDGPSGYLTLYPGDATRPVASSINPVSGESVKANGGVVGLSATGGIKVFTLTGPVNVVMDVTGYFVTATTGTGPAGATGPAGPTGPAGTARAYGHLASTDLMTDSKNVLSFQHNGAGDHCIQLDPGIAAATAVVTVTMDYAGDLTNSSRIQFSEVLAGVCGVNGIRIITMLYSFGGTSSTYADGAFYFSVA